MTVPKTPTIGRPFIARHTSTLQDTKLMLAGNVARLVHADLMLHSAAAGLQGLVPTNPRELDFALKLDGGVAEVEAAVKSLVAIGKLVEAEEDGYWLLTEWHNTQADLGGSTTRSATAAAKKFAAAHEAGKHAPGTRLGGDKGFRDGCQACADGLPHGPVETPAAAETVQEAPQNAQEQAGGVLDAKTVNDKLWSQFDRQVAADAEDGVPVLDTYLDLAALIVDQATPKFSHVPRVTGNTLENLLLSHAVKNVWGNDKAARAVHGLRSVHGLDRVLTLIVEHADKQNPLPYIKKVLEAAA